MKQVVPASGVWSARCFLWVLLSVGAGISLSACAAPKKVSIPVYREEVVVPPPEKKEQPAPKPAPVKRKEQPEPQPQLEPLPPPIEGVPSEEIPEVQPEVPAPVYVPPPPGQAGALLSSANKALQAGQFNQAEMHLERALRVEPRSAQLWYAMAQVRFGQQNYAQAVQFCLKSNSLAARNAAILQQNWLLIEKAYLKMGEVEKAAHARQKAGERF